MKRDVEDRSLVEGWVEGNHKVLDREISPRRSNQPGALPHPRVNGRDFHFWETRQ